MFVSERACVYGYTYTCVRRYTYTIHTNLDELGEQEGAGGASKSRLMTAGRMWSMLAIARSLSPVIMHICHIIMLAIARSLSPVHNIQPLAHCGRYRII